MTEKIHAEETENRSNVALDTGIGEMPFGREELLTEAQATNKREALRLFQSAYEAQMRGELDDATDLYLHSAIPWLRRAMNAPRYESYFYPHFNLGRVYESMGRAYDALREYKTAIDLNPKYALAVRAFRTLQAKLN